MLQRGQLVVEVEHLRQERKRLVRWAVEINKVVGHRRLPACINVVGSHSIESGLQVFGFEVADYKAVVAYKDGVVVPSRLAKCDQHVGPDHRSHQH